MAKIDIIKHAYRIVPVHPEDYYLLCISTVWPIFLNGF